MDLSHYDVQEVFQSGTLRERKRNLLRQMEEYAAAMLRNGCGTPAAPDDGPAAPPRHPNQ